MAIEMHDLTHVGATGSQRIPLSMTKGRDAYKRPTYTHTNVLQNSTVRPWKRLCMKNDSQALRKKISLVHCSAS